MRARGRWRLLLLLVQVLFFWKVLFTRQFSVFVDYESVNVAYAWYHFAASSLKHGILPLWDPFTLSGRSFIGEMQSGLFSPLKIWLYAWPLNRSGLFSPQLYQVHHVLLHLLAAVFMFVLAEEIGLGAFAALVASLCFALGGFVGAIGWPNMLEGAAWLPLILWLLIRSLRAARITGSIFYAWLAGLSLGMVILAGSLHIAIIDVLAISSAVAYLALREAKNPTGRGAFRSPWVWMATILPVVALASFCFGAVQLLPSVEYSKLALRYLGDGPPVAAAERIPYARLHHAFSPRSLFAFLFGSMGAGSAELSTYFGVMPSLLAVVGICRAWETAWVRYLTWLAGVAYFYTLGSFSLLHGLAYSFIPFVWMAREPGRFIYLTHFAMALLAGFGIQALFSRKLRRVPGRTSWIPNRDLKSPSRGGHRLRAKRISLENRQQDGAAEGRHRPSGSVAWLPRIGELLQLEAWPVPGAPGRAFTAEYR